MWFQQDGATSHTANEVMDFLRNIVIDWTCQIQVALNDQDQSRPYNMFTPIDEFEFWKYRYENLCGIKAQLENDDLIRITHMLKANQSAHIDRFEEVISHIEQALLEAKSNVEYLQILDEPCKEFELVESPAKGIELIPNILFLMRCYSPSQIEQRGGAGYRGVLGFLSCPPSMEQKLSLIYPNEERNETQIGSLHQSLYKVDELKKFVSLCMGLSNQLISLCTKFIDMNVMFSGKSQAAMKMFNMCIKSCQDYKKIFVRACSYPNEGEGQLARYPQIFNKVDTFIQRCQDTVEVCEAMIVFGRMDETIVIDKPSFALARAAEFESVCDSIESRFKTSLKKIENDQDMIFDVNSSTWYESILQFRREMKELEVMVENLLAEVFVTINNVTEGIDVLQNMYQYSKRKDLASEFEKRTIKVFKLFATEIQETRRELVEDKRQHPMGLPRYAGRALMAILKRNRLKTLMRTVNEAQWLMYCPIEEDVRSQYKKLMATLRDTVMGHHRRWMGFTSPDISRRFMRPLLTWSTKRPGLLEVNIDRKLLKTCQEAKLWQHMDFRVPAHIDMVMEKYPQLMLLFRNVEAVMMDYNRIISALSDQERMLFRELLKLCSRKIMPGLTKLTWITDMADVYVSDCSTHLECLQKFVDDYKNCNVEVVKLCEKICDTPLIDIPLHDPFMLKELVQVMADYR
ncbi:Dynein heavy chain 2, axonemal [Homalodisca vitripennis]|nr:Dynein heavy chain 2, axonemal [Homalodisca vitripennis]